MNRFPLTGELFGKHRFQRDKVSNRGLQIHLWIAHKRRLAYQSGRFRSPATLHLVLSTAAAEGSYLT